ncbi:MFS transporter [Rhodococcus aetherivorans]
MNKLTFSILAIGAGAFAMLQSVVVPTLPRIATEIGTDQHSVAWVLTAFLLCATVSTPIVGRLGDIYGKRRLLVVSLTLLSLGSIISAVAPNLAVMIGARVIAAAGAGVVPLSFGILRDGCSPGRMASATAALSAVLAGGAGLGMVVAGPLVDYLGYLWLFLLPGLVLGAAAVGAAFLVPSSPVSSPGRLPLLPAVLLTMWLVPLLIAASRAPEWGWGSVRVLGLCIAGVVMLVLWWVCESRVAVPLVDPALVRSRGMWQANLVGLAAGAALYGGFAFLPQFLQASPSSGYGFGVGATGASLLILAHPAMSFVGGFVAGGLSRIVGAKALVVMGCLAGAAAMVLMAFDHTTRVDVVVANGLMGAGLGLMFACLTPLIFAAVPVHQSGIAVGINTTLRSLGGAVGAAVLPAIIASQTVGDGYPSERAYVVGFLVVAGLMACAAFCALLIPSERKRDELDSQLKDVPFTRK